MATSFKMAKLDFYTLKGQLAAYLIMPIIAYLFLSMNSSALLLGFTAMWLVLIINMNLFALEEKYHLERLYSMLAVSRKQLILGRYLSTTLNFVVGFIFIFATTIIFSVINKQIIIWQDILVGFFISFFGFAIVSAVQLPIYFGFGYNRGRFLSILPFLILVGGIGLSSVNEKIAKVVYFILSNDISLMYLAGGILILGISYLISLACYKKP